MSIIFIPALISLLLKLFVLAHVIKGGRISNLFLSLIVVFAAHNAIETLGYLLYYKSNSDIAFIIFRFYYITTIYLLLCILLHGLSISKLENQFTTLSLIGAATTLSALVLFTNTVVAGEYTIGYSMTAVKGDYYWLFSAFLISSLVSTIAALTYGYRTFSTQLEKTRCKYSLLALMPIFIISSVAITLKIVDAKVNAAGLIPIATTLFLIIILQTESKHKLSNIRRLLPLSLERQTANNFLLLLDNYVKNSGKDNAYKELQHGIEREVVSYSLKKCNNNITHTANMMGIRNRSTLYTMINRLDIDIKNVKE